MHSVKKPLNGFFADAKENHATRYTHYRDLAAVTRWGRLEYAAMNLKKRQIGVGRTPYFSNLIPIFSYICQIPCFLPVKTGDSLRN